MIQIISENPPATLYAVTSKRARQGLAPVTLRNSIWWVTMDDRIVGVECRGKLYNLKEVFMTRDVAATAMQVEIKKELARAGDEYTRKTNHLDAAAAACEKFRNSKVV